MNSLKAVLICGFVFIAALFLDSPVGYMLFIRHTGALIAGCAVVLIVFFVLILAVKTEERPGLLIKQK